MPDNTDSIDRWLAGIDADPHLTTAARKVASTIAMDFRVHGHSRMSASEIADRAGLIEDARVGIDLLKKRGWLASQRVGRNAELRPMMAKVVVE